MEHAIAVALGSVRPRAASFPPDHSAEIVAFPRPCPPPAQSDAPQLAPLLKAAERLQAAACAQKAAIAVWRGSLDDAAQSLKALEGSMAGYERRLASLDLNEIGARSRELAAIMDKAIVAQG